MQRGEFMRRGLPDAAPAEAACSQTNIIIIIINIHIMLIIQIIIIITIIIIILTTIIILLLIITIITIILIITTIIILVMYNIMNYTIASPPGRGARRSRLRPERDLHSDVLRGGEGTVD